MTARGSLFLGTVLGAALGALAMHLLGATRTQEPLGDEGASLRAHVPEQGAGPMLEGSRAADANTAAPPAPLAQAGDLQLGLEAFLATYRTTFRRATGSDPTPQQEQAAWAMLRSSATSMPAGLASQAARAVLESRQRAEVSERDDIMALLDDDKRAQDVAALRNDPEVFHRLLAHRIKATTVDGRSAATDADEEPLADGTRLLFPDGVFVVSEALVLGKGKSRMPRDLTIEGSSMDRTLVTLSDFSARDVVWNLHLKDLTIDCGNDGAFDLRSKKASVYAENVRFVRFDAGHGGCQIFDFWRGGAVLCCDCRFDGGYGRSPGMGSILRGPNVARFEDCTFERISYVIDGPACYARCMFRDCPPMPDLIERTVAGSASEGLRFEECRTESSLVMDHPHDSDALRRDLKTLFPAFTGE